MANPYMAPGSEAAFDAACDRLGDTLVTHRSPTTAYLEGQRAAAGDNNPYAQRSGELWHTENQDQKYDEWQRGREDTEYRLRESLAKNTQYTDSRSYEDSAARKLKPITTRVILPKERL